MMQCIKAYDFDQLLVMMHESLSNFGQVSAIMFENLRDFDQL